MPYEQRKTQDDRILNTHTYKREEERECVCVCVCVCVCGCVKMKRVVEIFTGLKAS